MSRSSTAGPRPVSSVPLYRRCQVTTTQFRHSLIRTSVHSDKQLKTAQPTCGVRVPDHRTHLSQAQPRLAQRVSGSCLQWEAGLRRFRTPAASAWRVCAVCLCKHLQSTTLCHESSLVSLSCLCHNKKTLTILGAAGLAKVLPWAHPSLAGGGGGRMAGEMQYRNLGRTGLKVSLLSYGG